MAGLDMILQGGRTAISPEFLRLLGVGLQDAVAPTLAEMMPTTAGAAGGGAALPLVGGAAALAALGAGGAAVNDMVVGRQRDPGGLLESLRAAAERDPRALPLYERELRRMGGTPPAPTSAAPPSVTPEAMELFGYAPLMAAKNALTQKSAASLPASRGPAGNRVGVAAPNAEFEALMKRQGDLAREGADLRGKAAADTKVSDWANQRREFDKTNVLNVPDPMYSRAISDAMIAFGGRMLANEGHIKDSVEVGGKAWMAGRDRNEKQAQDAQDRRLKNFMDTMGLSQKDAESLSAKDKAVLEAALAGIGAKGGDIAPRLDFAKEGRKEAHDMAKIDREMAGRAKIAAASHAPKTSLTQLIDEYVAAKTKHGPLADQYLRKGRDTTAEKFDEKGYEAHMSAAKALTDQIKDPERRKAAMTAWQMDSLDSEIGPRGATEKLNRYITKPAGK